MSGQVVRVGPGKEDEDGKKVPCKVFRFWIFGGHGVLLIKSFL